MKHYQNDREKVIQRAKDAGLIGMVTSSISPGSFRRTLGIVEKHRGYIHHTAGCQASLLTLNEAERIISLIRKYSKDIVAIGEVGLDYHWVRDNAARKAQEPLFKMFLELADELNLPIVIHSRKAESEATKILEQSFSGSVLMHCYDGSPETTRRVADNGWFITLPANFSHYRNRVSAAKTMPLEQILLETDGPYLSPVEGRNEPANLAFGCKALADALGIGIDEVANITTANALAFYNV